MVKYCANIFLQFFFQFFVFEFIGIIQKQWSWIVFFKNKSELTSCLAVYMIYNRETMPTLQ